MQMSSCLSALHAQYSQLPSKTVTMFNLDSLNKKMDKFFE
jgi:hypothetical protein